MFGFPISGIHEDIVVNDPGKMCAEIPDRSFVAVVVNAIVVDAGVKCSV